MSCGVLMVRWPLFQQQNGNAFMLHGLSLPPPGWVIVFLLQEWQGISVSVGSEVRWIYVCSGLPVHPRESLSQLAAMKVVLGPLISGIPKLNSFQVTQ